MAEDILKGGKRRKGTVGSFPVPQDFSAEGKRFAQSVNDSLQQLRGEKGNRLDSACTFADLIELGIAEKNPIQTTGGGNTLTTRSSGITNILKSTSQEGVDFPTAPTGASASAAFKNIIISWDYPKYNAHSHTEIYVFDTDQYNLLQIEKGKLSPNFLGQTTATVFAHTITGSTGTTKRYWVRHVNKNNVAGPVHDQTLAGLSATTARIDTPDIETASIGTAQIQDAAVDTAKIADLAVTNAKVGTLQGDKIDVNTLNANRITASSLDVGGKGISGSIGRISGTAGNDGTIVNEAEIFQGNFTNASPNHIAAANHSDANVSAGDVMGGSPIFSHSFTTFNYSGSRDFIIQVYLDPLGSYGSSSSVGFAYAMRQTTNSGAYTSTSASDYISMRGTSKAGSISSQNPMLTDVVSLSGNTTFFIWAFAVADDVTNAAFRDGQISVMGLNK